MQIEYTYGVTLPSRLTFQNLERTMWLAQLGKGMLFSVKQAFEGRDEIRAPLKTPPWEVSSHHASQIFDRAGLKFDLGLVFKFLND